MLWCYTYAVNCGYVLVLVASVLVLVLASEVLVLVIVLEATVLETSLHINTSM